VCGYARGGAGTIVFVDADYESWLRWWRATGRVELEGILRRRWIPHATDLERREVCARYATRIGMRLRHGISGAEIAELLEAADRKHGVRVDERRLAAVAMEIRSWYREQRGDRARAHWPMRFTREEV
jgi:hypothetical protein